MSANITFTEKEQLRPFDISIALSNSWIHDRSQCDGEEGEGGGGGGGRRRRGGGGRSGRKKG